MNKIENKIMSDMKSDIDKMILLISAFTPEDSQGYDLLQEWIKKYSDKNMVLICPKCKSPSK